MLNISNIHDLPSEVRKSVADQLKLLAWALGGFNGYFRHSLGNLSGGLMVLFGWIFLQFLAHYLLYNIKEFKKGVKNDCATINFD